MIAPDGNMLDRIPDFLLDRSPISRDQATFEQSHLDFLLHAIEVE
jgi:hypothetical protein